MEQSGESRRVRAGAIRIGVAYFVIASLWILGSDQVAALIARDSEQFQLIQSFKGIGFVAVMAVLVGISALRLARTEAARQREQAVSSIDAITGLPNARAFYAAIASRLAYRDERCCVLLLDLRGFARINATFGRHAGDRLLFSIGRRLRTLMSEESVVARLEEDKFGVLMSVDSPQEAAAMSDRVIERFRSELRVNGKGVVLDVNVGYAISEEDSDQVAGLLDAADLALRTAKLSGHNVGQRFSSELLQSRREHFHLEAELRQALARQQLTIHLQPQYELESGRLNSAEALVRWKHLERGMIHPGVFVPVAEQSGLIDRLGEYVLHLACKAMHDWREGGLPGLRVAVNVAGHQLDDERLGFYLKEAAGDWSVPLSALEIEITETMAMRNPEQAIDVLRHLRELGVTIALDDFGTGYSSLSYLLQMPVDKLKIDRSFIAGLEHNRRQRVFVGTLIALGRDLGMKVVAEGVETEAQRDHLRELGCELGQGYLLGRPMSVEDFSELLRVSTVTGSIRPS